MIMWRCCRNLHPPWTTTAQLLDYNYNYDDDARTHICQAVIIRRHYLVDEQGGKNNPQRSEPGHGRRPGKGILTTTTTTQYSRLLFRWTQQSG